MIISSATKKVAATILPHDSRLALQTAAAYFAIRQLVLSSTTVAASATPTLPSPPSPSDPGNQSSPSTNRSGNMKNGLSKSVLEYIFLAIVIFIIICVVLRRYLRVRREGSSNLPVLNSSARHYTSASRRYPGYRQVELQPLRADGQPYPPYPDPYLPGFPAAYMSHNRRRTRATDTDPRGRRLGDIAVESDHDGELGIKDALPAYDNSGGPPKYLESEMQNRNRPPLNETVHRPDVSLENTDNSSLPLNDNSTVISGHTGRRQISQQAENDTSHPMPPSLENSLSNNDSAPATIRNET